MIPHFNEDLYKIAERGIKDIGVTQELIRKKLSNETKGLIDSILDYLSKEEDLSITQLYNLQLENVSSLNGVLPEAIGRSNEELQGIESKIDSLYSSLVNVAEKRNSIEMETAEIQSELNRILFAGHLKDSPEYYRNSMNKSSLERKLAKNKHAIVILKDYTGNAPAEISILESHQKILQTSISRCEYVLQKSLHIESVLTDCLGSIESINTKQNLLQRLGTAFSDIEEYVWQITNYASKELLSASDNITESSSRLCISSENSTAQISVLGFLNDFK